MAPGATEVVGGPGPVEEGEAFPALSSAGADPAPAGRRRSTRRAPAVPSRRGSRGRRESAGRRRTTTTDGLVRGRRGQVKATAAATAAHPARAGAGQGRGRGPGPRRHRRGRGTERRLRRCCPGHQWRRCLGHPRRRRRPESASSGPVRGRTGVRERGQRHPGRGRWGPRIRGDGAREGDAARPREQRRPGRRSGTSGPFTRRRRPARAAAEGAMFHVKRSARPLTRVSVPGRAGRPDGGSRDGPRASRRRPSATVVHRLSTGTHRGSGVGVDGRRARIRAGEGPAART